MLGEAIKSVSCDNGMGIPPEIKEKLFQPFSITLFAEPAPRSASATLHERHALLDSGADRRGRQPLPWG